MDAGADAVGPTVRLATRADAAQVAWVHVRTWQAAYRGLMPDAFLDALRVTDRARRWRGILPAAAEGAEPGTIPRCTWVGITEDVVGFCSLGPSRDPGAADAEVYALYVLAVHWRTGMGARLLATAEAAAHAAGSPSVSLWTLRDNHRARGFYERMGYATDGGSRDDAVGGVALAHVRYRKPLGVARVGC